MQNKINHKMVCLCLIIVLNIGAAQAQTQQGLMSRLIEIKYGTELYLSYQIKKESGRTQNEIDTALANYNTIRWKVDGLVYQISAEMIMQNSPAVMRKLDAWSYGQNESVTIKKYVAQLKEIEQLYTDVIVPKIYPNDKRTLNLTTNVFYLLKDSYSIVKGLSDLKTRKVMALVELLDHARLMGPGEVMKMGK